MALHPRTLAFGTWLAARGALAGAGMGLALLGALASVVAAVALEGTGSATAGELPLLESAAMAWSAGLLLAFGAALRALARDREQGVIALARARGASLAAYVAGRVGGLVLLLAVVLGGATLVAGAAATTAAHGSPMAARFSAAGVAYALAFAMTMGPVAMATLGGRTRTGGLLALLTVVLLPELVAPWTLGLLPHGWTELTSIPAGLAAIRAGAIAPGAMLAPALRAAVGLATVTIVSLLLVAGRARRARAADADGAR